MADGGGKSWPSVIDVISHVKRLGAGCSTYVVESQLQFTRAQPCTTPRVFHKRVSHPACFKSGPRSGRSPAGPGRAPGGVCFQRAGAPEPFGVVRYLLNGGVDTPFGKQGAGCRACEKTSFGEGAPPSEIQGRIDTIPADAPGFSAFSYPSTTRYPSWGPHVESRVVSAELLNTTAAATERIANALHLATFGG
jgi:hypothetical protein